MHDVFISYSSKDKVVADAVCAGLEQRGIRCWIAPRDIMAGVQWGHAIVDAISNARVMVLLLSGHANSSQQIPKEVDRAVDKGVAIIPLRIEDVQPAGALEYYLGPAHWLDAITPPMQAHVERLAVNIRSLLSQPKGKASLVGNANMQSRPARPATTPGAGPPPAPPKQGPPASTYAPQSRPGVAPPPVAYAAPIAPPGVTADGTKVLLYLLAGFVPIAGIVMFFVYNAKPLPSERKLAQVLLIIGLVATVVWSVLGCFCLAAIGSADSGL